MMQKKLIEKYFLFEAKVSFQDFMNQLLLCYSDFKYTSLIIFFNNKLYSLVIKTLEKSIKIIDNLFANSTYRKNNFYISKQNVPRTIVDIFGVLSFNRNYYTSIDKTNCFFFIDKIFCFEKYKTYSRLVR